MTLPAKPLTPAAQLGDKISRAGVVASTGERLPEMGRVAMEYADDQTHAVVLRVDEAYTRLKTEMDKLGEVIQQERDFWAAKVAARGKP